MKHTAILAAIAGVTLALTSTFVNADCMKDFTGKVVCGAGPCARDFTGNVHCSIFRKGSAVQTYSGDIACSIGDCMEAWNGDIVCSTEFGGAVMKGFNGEPVCQGQCVLASDRYCESRPAGEWRK